ncbi:hypothetical protein GHK86_07870 [Acidimicrobiaceae bacterium USS-CC1]|uniref:Uncharacterized protein n=1 Tax=Acidiferrimicrobium australe TaxID=2664430 RepID=A0ABW9QTE2_9ACTN|nr:hypothetical protein [Acidiferrimicrobium australe]
MHARNSKVWRGPFTGVEGARLALVRLAETAEVFAESGADLPARLVSQVADDIAELLVAGEDQ